MRHVDVEALHCKHPPPAVLPSPNALLLLLFSLIFLRFNTCTSAPLQHHWPTSHGGVQQSLGHEHVLDVHPRLQQVVHEVGGAANGAPQYRAQQPELRPCVGQSKDLVHATNASIALLVQAIRVRGEGGASQKVCVASGDAERQHLRACG